MNTDYQPATEYQLGLFDELPRAPAKSFRATVVRSHYRRVPGDPDIPASAKPQTGMMSGAATLSATQTQASPAPIKPVQAPQRPVEPRQPLAATQSATKPPRAPQNPNPVVHNGTRTSKAAAQGLDPEQQTTQAARCFGAVLRSMTSSPMGMTRQELSSVLNIKEGIVCARVRPMVTGADTRFPLVEPGLTRIGSEGARQKVLWVAIEKQEPIECECQECGGKGVSRLFEVSEPGRHDPSQPIFAGYLTVRSCTCPGCWWSDVA